MKACTFAVLALAVACVSRETESKRALSADTGRVVRTASAQRPATATPVDSAAIRAGCTAMRAAFDSIATELRDRAVIESPKDSVAEFPGRLRGGREYACVTSLEDSTTGASTTEHLHELLARNGWRMRSALIDAGGPDGESVGYGRANAACVLRSSWDGGNDDDTTYIPTPGVRIEAICYADRPDPTNP